MYASDMYDATQRWIKPFLARGWAHKDNLWRETESEFMTSQFPLRLSPHLDGQPFTIRLSFKNPSGAPSNSLT